MQDVQQPVADSTPLPLRSDTILGVCEALGRDFGFHPNWLRIVFAAVFYLSPVGVSAVYLGLGVVVALTRWFYPAQAAAASARPSLVEVPAEPQAETCEERGPERLAA